MILIGTDGGIFRWFEGCNWATFHALQDRAVVGLASPGAGVLVAVDRAGDVLESTNNGMDWRPLPLPAGAGRPSAVAVDGTPPAVVLAVKPLGVYRRAVGAPTPGAAADGPSGPGFAPLLIHRARGLAEGATALVVPRRVRERPGAEAVRLAGWTPLSAPPAPQSAVAPEVRALASVPGSLFAAVSGAGVWKSGDAGRSWARCPDLPAEVYAVRPVPGRAGHVWAATQDGCWLSTDGGETWEDRSVGLENARHARAIEVKPDEPDALLAGAAPAGSNETGVASRQGLNFALYESKNGGKSWTHVMRNFPDVLETDTITDIRYDPSAPDNVVVAFGSGELRITTNGGAYWGLLARQTRAARVLCAVR